MIDSHCHLTDPRLRAQLREVLKRARAAGVDRIVTIGTGPDDNRAAIELCREHANVRCATGIHPNYCHEVDESELRRLPEIASDPSVVALGEMGLDYHYDFADRARQRRFFEAQLAIAVERNLPVVIHCREAIDDTLAIMGGPSRSVRAVFHCFTGSLAEGERVLDAGYLIGFTGVITFKRSEDLRELARRVPGDKLLVETDAPYLSPEPMRRQKVNEPALVVHTAAVVAEARGVSLATIDAMTTKNTELFYGWT